MLHIPTPAAKMDTNRRYTITSPTVTAVVTAAVTVMVTAMVAGVIGDATINDNDHIRISPNSLITLSPLVRTTTTTVTMTKTIENTSLTSSRHIPS